MDEFKVGSTVRLASGGPLMTVSKAYNDPNTGSLKVLCQWFAGNKLESGTFPSESLAMVIAE